MRGRAPVQIFKFFKVIQFLLMLLGLAFPNGDNNTTISDKQTQQTEIATQSADSSGSDTKGNTGQTPPPAP